MQQRRALLLVSVQGTQDPLCMQSGAGAPFFRGVSHAPLPSPVTPVQRSAKRGAALTVAVLELGTALVLTMCEGRKKGNSPGAHQM